MNTREQSITQAVESIGLMQHSLVSLCERTLTVNPRLFAVMAEGPMDQIRDLLNQIDALLEEERRAVENSREEVLAS